MTRRFAWFSIGLTACVSFLVGMVVTGTLTPTTATSAPSVAATKSREDRPFMPGIAGVVNFADVAERVNPAVVNIDASSRSRRLSRVPLGSGLPAPRPDALDDPLEFRRRG